MSVTDNRVKLVFHLKFVNSLDHFAPVVWKLLTNHPICHVILYGPRKWEEDYRVAYLKRWRNLSYKKISLYDRIRHRLLSNRVVLVAYQKLAIFRGIHKFIGTFILPNSLFFNGRPSALIYEWGGPFRTNHFDAINNSIPTFCLPHGTWSYLNFDISNKHKDYHLKSTPKPDFSNRNIFDHYVFQTSEHEAGFRNWGISSKITHVWGNPRFSPDWSSINKELAPKFVSPFREQPSVKCLVFLIPEIYRVSESKVLELVKCLLEFPGIQVVFCARPDCIPSVQELVGQELDENRNKVRNAVFDFESPPPALVEWSDVVLNYGSSIVFEAFLQGKPVIHMPFLQENTTIFDNTEVVSSTDSVNDVTRLLNKYISGQLPLPSEEALTAFLKWQNVILDGDLSPPALFAREILACSVKKPDHSC